MDILRHGELVRVLAPPTLAQAVAQQLRAAAAVYKELPKATG
jgi:hypothetical protein